VDHRWRLAGVMQSGVIDEWSVFLVWGFYGCGGMGVGVGKVGDVLACGGGGFVAAGAMGLRISFGMVGGWVRVRGYWCGLRRSGWLMIFYWGLWAGEWECGVWNECGGV